MKRFLTAILLIISTLAFSATAYAASETKDLFTIDSTYDMAVSVLFDKEQPKISFTAPDGTVIDGENLRFDKGDDWVQYYIQDAAPGTWGITYDKLSNTEFEVNYSSYTNPIEITDFTFGTAEENYLPVTFTVASEDEGSYEYKSICCIA